ncbi:MAG: helix-turn-helix transcriptional regulator [Candidatus Thiodiazotropha sp.]
MLFANQSAESILALCDGVALGVKGIRLAVMADQQRLQQIIARATVDVSGRSVPVAGGMKFQSQEGNCRLSILVTPLNPDRVDADLDARRCALIFLSDGQPDIGLNSEIVSELYGLTESEARVEALLCQGLTMTEIAERLSISNNTIKTHLKSVFHKTHTRRQTELVNLINTGPAGIGLRKYR